MSFRAVPPNPCRIQVPFLVLIQLLNQNNLWMERTGKIKVDHLMGIALKSALFYIFLVL